MADNNLSGTEPGPDVTTPPTRETLVEDISNLLEDPATDLPEESEDSEAAEAEPEGVVDDDPLGLDVEAEDVGEADAEDEDGSEEPEIKGGRFAPDTAKVTLEDGTVITVAELKRNNLFQRDYTKKTTELKAEREAIDTRKSEVDQQAQSLDQFREYAAWYAEQFLPKQPEPFKGDPATDPIGFMQWQQKNGEWLAHVNAYQTFHQQGAAKTQKQQEEAHAMAAERHTQEKALLLKAMPVLKDPVKGQQVWDALKAGAIEHYHMTAEEFGSIRDHRMLVALRDALAYRRIKAQAPKVQAQVAAKPAMKPGKRTAPQAALSKERQVRTERLRNSGSFADGVAALSDFDL